MEREGGREAQDNDPNVVSSDRKRGVWLTIFDEWERAEGGCHERRRECGEGPPPERGFCQLEGSCGEPSLSSLSFFLLFIC